MPVRRSLKGHLLLNLALRTAGSHLEPVRELLRWKPYSGGFLLSDPSTQPLILLVEDELLLLDELKSALEDAGFLVLAASNGVDALSFLEAEAASIRALITDINLGEGTTGWELAHFAREQNADLPVVYASGGNESDWAVNGVPKSVFIAKPFAPAQVVVAVSALLNSGEPG